MNICFDLNRINYERFFPQPENQVGKKWSYSYVYSFVDLRNIFLLLISDRHFKSFKEISTYCNNKNILSEKGKKWTVRSVEEVVNALRNFKMIDSNGFLPIIKNPFQSNIGQELLNADYLFFKKIFGSYFRFCEFHSLFLLTGNNSPKLEDLQLSSSMIYSYISEGRFVNRFLTKDNTLIQGIDTTNSDFMRFWDVYVKWGTMLGLIEKYPVKPFGVTTLPIVKSLSLTYFVREMPNDFSVFTYIEEEIGATFLYIPDVIFSIIKNRRYSLSRILDKLTLECKTDDRFRAQSASTIFINEKEKFLIPKINNSFVTHLLKL